MPKKRVQMSSQNTCLSKGRNTFIPQRNWGLNKRNNTRNGIYMKKYKTF